MIYERRHSPEATGRERGGGGGGACGTTTKFLPSLFPFISVEHPSALLLSPFPLLCPLPISHIPNGRRDALTLEFVHLLDGFNKNRRPAFGFSDGGCGNVRARRPT